MELPDTVLREHLRERVGDLLLLKSDGAVEIVPIVGHRREVVLALEQELGELPGAVRTEVEEDCRVSRAEPRPRKNDRLEELVRYAGLVARLDRDDSVFRRSPDAVHDRS